MSHKPLDLVDPQAIEHLYSVASALFAERGREGVSVREISRAADVSVAAIYYHFGSKEGLFEEVSLHKYEDFERAVLQRTRTAGNGPVDAAQLALAFFDTLTADRNLLRLLQRDMIVEPATQTRFLSHRQYQHFRQVIERQLQLEAGSFEGEMMLFSFAAVINGYCELVMANLGTSDEADAEHIARHRRYLDAFVRRMFAPPPGG